MKKVLIIVDLQQDFYSPDGNLYVDEGEKLLTKIGNVIPNFDEVIFTLDWHPVNHCSFLENGGQWSQHCVQYTQGASIPLDLIEINKNNTSFYRKGMISTIEEYGAFAIPYVSEETNLKKHLCALNSDIVICGIAGDYCVLETIKNLLKLVPKERVSVFLDGIVSIDKGEKLNKFIQEHNLKIYKNDNR